MQMCEYWRAALNESAHGSSSEIEIASWLSRATLDAIGEGLSLVFLESPDVLIIL